MAMALMIENINNDFTLYPSGRSEITTNNGSYYKFYQSKLRQLVTQTRYRKEQEARVARQRPVNDNRVSEQRLHREYMNHIRERSKMQAQEILSGRLEDQRKRSDSVTSTRTRTITLSITSTNYSTSIETRAKPIVKPKPQAPTPVKPSRIISAPTSSSSQRTINKPKIVPTIKIDCVEEGLSKANIHSFTQVSSSSSSLPNLDKKTQRARRSILDTIMLHLNKHIPSNESKRPVYEDIDNKFSSSIAPTVYECFQRIAV